MKLSHNINRKNFFDHFPTPKFLKMPTVGLALSDGAIRMVQLSKKRGVFKLESHGEVALERGVIHEGYIHNKENLARVVRELKVRKDLSFVKASLPEEKGYVFTVRIPLLSYGEMRSSIEFKIEENAPVKLSEVIFDFNIVPNSQNEDGTVDVAVSALPVEVVSEYVAALQMAGVEPVAFEVESQAIARSVISQSEKGVYIIVNLSIRKAGIYIVRQGVVVFTSTIAFDEDSRDGYALETYLSKEIEKTLVFWETYLGDEVRQTEHVTSVRIVGSHPSLHAIKNYLSQEQTVPVELSNVWINVFSFDTYVPDIKKENSLKFAAAVGLALPAQLK